MADQMDVISFARELASSLAMPIFIVDPNGTLLYYNRPAENILGRKFQETGKLQASIWSRLFVPTDEHRTPLLPDSLPLMIALTERTPIHKDIWIKGLDNISRHIEVTAFPLIEKSGKFLGAMSIFWEIKE